MNILGINYEKHKSSPASETCNIGKVQKSTTVRNNNIQHDHYFIRLNNDRPYTIGVLDGDGPKNVTALFPQSRFSEILNACQLPVSRCMRLCFS